MAQPISVLRAAVALGGVCGLAVSIQAADAQPAQVILMRHGHKGSASNNYNLSPIGFQRATALASVIPACYGTPSHIVTYFLDPETSQNARSYQTAVPLAVASGVNIRIDRSSVVDSVESGRSMLSNPTYSGGLLVVFWEHRHLPQLAAGLGWPAMPPIDDNDFDTLYRLSYSPGSAVPQVTRFSQTALLDGLALQPAGPPIHCCCTELMAAFKALALSALAFTPVAVRADPSPAAGVSLNPAPLERVVGTPPAARSAEAGQDLAILLWLQQARTPEIVSSSWTLLERNPTAFSRALGVDMVRTTPRLNTALKAFLKPVDGIKDQIKDRVNRPRPFVSHPQIIPCLPLEASASFPSGHSTWYRAASELLADLLPERRSRLLELGRHGGNSRVFCGMHYPSDVEAGQRLGVAAANQLIQSPQWRAFKADPAVQAELDQVRKAPASALPVLVH